MGLDLIEYALAVEDAFELSIPDDEWALLTTPGKLIDYLSAHLRVGDAGPPLVQTAFYRLRRAVASELRIDRKTIAPTSTLRALAPQRSERELMHAVAARLGLAPRDLSHSPVLGALSQMRLVSGRTLASVAQELAMRRPAKMKPSVSFWTRAQITEVTMRLLEHEVGVDLAKVQPHHTFVGDLGMG